MLMSLAFSFFCCFLLPLHSANISFKSENKQLEKKLKQKFEKTGVLNKEEVLSFLKENAYYTSDVTQSGNLFTVKNPVRWELIFENNQQYNHHSLRQIAANGIYSPDPKRFKEELKINLKTFYAKEAYPFATIKVSEFSMKTPYLRRLIVVVQAKQKVKVRKFYLNGSFKPLSEDLILNKIYEFSTNPLSLNYYSNSSFLSTVESLKNDLKNRGYFRSEVSVEKVQFTRDKKEVDLHIKVDLNAPTLIGKISYSGNENASDFFLTALLNLNAGDKINLYTLQEGLDKIEDYYLSRGFLDVSVEKDKILSYSKNLERVDINIPIQESDQILVEKIKLIGLNKTKKSVVFHELNFKEGDVLTLNRIEESNANLQNTGLFSNIRIRPLEKTKGQIGNTVLVSLTERKPGSFVAGLGINTELGLTAKGFAGLSYKNLNGKARSISSRLELRRNLRNINYLENRIFLNYTEPYIFCSRCKFKINLSRFDDIWDYNKNSANGELVTLIESNRIDLIFENQFNKHIKLLFYTLSFDLRREREIRGKFPVIKEFIGSTGPRLEFDYRDNPYFPTDGFFSSFQFEYASPLLNSNTKSTYGNFDLEYISMQAAHTFYEKLRPRLIFAQSFRGGYLYNFSDQNNGNFFPFPKTRAFFLGGANSLRGFDPSKGNERIPNDNTLSQNNLILNGKTTGGGLLSIPSSSYFYLSKSELRFPLYKDSNLWGALFYDGGSVQIAGVNGLDPWRHSVGVGLRYNTPLGTLFNIELAYKLDRKSQFKESVAQFHLSVSSF